jgi:hypothetical protein
MSLYPIVLWSCGLVAAAVAMTVAVNVSAAPPQEMLMRYHQAIYAVAECEDLPLYHHGPGEPNGTTAQDLHAAMASVIESRVGVSMSPGEELSLIEEAKRDAHDLIVDAGCSSPEVMDLRGLFHAEIEPALP